MDLLDPQVPCPTSCSQVITMTGASLVAQTVKRLSAMREPRVPSLGREDPMEKEMATHSSSLAWEIPQTREAW